MLRSLFARSLLSTLILVAVSVGLAGQLGSSALAWTLTIVLVVALASLATWIAIRPHNQAMADLTQTARRVAKGDLSARASSLEADIGPLAHSLDAIATSMEDKLDSASREQSRLLAVLDAMNEAVLVTDATGRIVLTNAALTSLAGTSCVGMTVVEAVRSSHLSDAVSRAMAGETGKVEFESSNARDSRAIVAHVGPLPRQAGVVAVLHDVSELRLAASVRRDFVANASHELRTPLTAIRGFAETLADGALENPTIAKRFVHTILENSVRLEAIVNDLLELSRSESPDAHFGKDPVELGPAMDAVLRSLEGRAAARNVTLQLKQLNDVVVAIGDGKAIDHVVLNLVENAIKYTVEGDTVLVQLSQDAEYATIVVKDHGPGIGPQHLPRIFERFYRVDRGRARAQGGTGLGLAIVKHLLTRMNGDVSVTSASGEGTQFSVRLPLWTET